MLPVIEVATLREIAAVTPNPQALVMSCDIGNRRPGWDFAPRCSSAQAPHRDGRGALRSRPVVEGVDDAGALVELKPNCGKAAMKRGPYDLHREPRQPLNWRAGSPLSISAARAEYFAWQDALVRLVAMLRGALVEYEPVAPTAVAFPWIDGQPTSRVLSDGFPDGLLTVSLGLGRLARRLRGRMKPILRLKLGAQMNYQRARIRNIKSVRGYVYGERVMRLEIDPSDTLRRGKGLDRSVRDDCARSCRPRRFACAPPSLADRRSPHGTKGPSQGWGARAAAAARTFSSFAVRKPRLTELTQSQIG
ncbi:hypothetical protein [Tardiphaga robiniae]|uniref:hypothetical protein n=1 Tax=Tardiphaga robiniae TaxID=943830 RepID=UPI001585E830|nr:hypothetical protein [Tardiphaga robiniae]NUU41561.1 hypothetical protein [Tardiphaga robiniae]